MTNNSWFEDRSNLPQYIRSNQTLTVYKVVEYGEQPWVAYIEGQANKRKRVILSYFSPAIEAEYLERIHRGKESKKIDWIIKEYGCWQHYATALEESLADHDRIVREMDIAMHGESDAAKQASLCDIQASLIALIKERDELQLKLHEALPDDCVQGYLEVKFCPHRNSDTAACKQCG